MIREAAWTQRIMTAAMNVVVGAAGGALIAGLFLLLGVIGAVFFMMTGGELETLNASDLRLAGWYVGAFSVAGGTVGLARPLLRRRSGYYFVLAGAGAMVTNAIAVADGGLAEMTAVHWTVMTIIGVIFGLAGARGFLGAAPE